MGYGIDEEDDEIVLDPDVKIRRGYVWMPYTVPRIRRIFKEDYNVELIWCNCWYKCGRSPFYKQRYLSMDDLRCFLAKNDYPLYDEKSAVNASKPKRNKGAVRFMQAVEDIMHS